MNKRFVATLLTILIIGGGAGVAVYLAKGYTFSSRDGRLIGTGIITVSSVPDGASVYIDGHLATATNTTISQLKPRSYNVKIIKDGFIPWEKTTEVREGLVSEIKASLFPALPTFYPLTFNGVSRTLLSQDGQRLAFEVPMSSDSPTRQKGGIWVWTMSSQPISFNRGAQPQQIVASAPGLDFSKADLRFSPDSTQVLVTLQEGDREGEENLRNYLLPVDRHTSLSDLRDITPILSSTLKEWEEDQKSKDEGRILAIRDLQLRRIASSAAILRWSPDETKFITVEKPAAKVYDLVLPVKVAPTNKEGSLPWEALRVGKYKEYTLPPALDYFWLPDSRHVILLEENNISIGDFDGSNKAVIYSGDFERKAVYPWPDSSRLVIMTSFNTPTASKPNLFGINLR